MIKKHFEHSTASRSALMPISGLIAVLGLIAGPTSVFGYNVTQGNGNNLSWSSDEVTINAEDDSFPEGNDFRAALQTLMGRMNDNPSQFEMQLDLDDDNVSLNNRDNEIWFTSTLGAPARANWWFQTRSGQLVETDVRVNSSRNWTAGIQKDATTPYDGMGRPFRNVVIHELGHTYGLAHETDTYNAMGQDWDHIHANGSFARGYLGEDASNGAVAQYGKDSGKGEDLSVSHWRHTGDDGEYSTHGRTRIFDTSGNELSNASWGDEPRYEVTRGNTVKAEFTYENSGLSTHTIDAGFYLSQNDTITTLDRHLKTTRIILGRNDVWTKRFEVPIPSDLLPNTDYHIGVIVDEQDSVSENLEANNATYIGIRTDRGSLPSEFARWLGTYQGRNDGRRAKLTISKDTSGVGQHEGASFDVTLEDLERSTTFTGNVDYPFEGPKHELEIGTLTASDGTTKRLPRLLLHTWDDDFLSGYTTWQGDPFGAAFAAEGPKADLLTERNGSRLDTDQPKQAWDGTYEGRNDGRDAELVIESTDLVTKKGDRRFLNFDIRFRDLDRNTELTGTGFVDQAGPAHIMRFFSPLTGKNGNTKEMQRLLLHTWDTTFVSGYNEWQGSPFGMLFAEKPFRYAGIPHQPIGDVVLKRTADGLLQIANFGTSGESGVNLQLEESANELSLELMPLSLNESARIDFDVMGATVDAESIKLGRVGLKRLDTRALVLADWTPIGASNTRFEIYRDGELVERIDGADQIELFGEADELPSLTGVKAVAGSTESPRPSVALAFNGTASMEPISSDSASASQAPLVGDEVRAIAGSDSESLAEITGLELFGSNLDSVTITGETAGSTGPDLQIEEFALEGGDSLERGVGIGDRIQLMIANAGNESASGSFSIGFYLSSDATITTEDALLVGGREGASDLDAGATTMVGLFSGAEIPSDFPGGSAFLGVVLDEGNSISETNETNNTASSAVTVVDQTTQPEPTLEISSDADGTLNLKWKEEAILQGADRIGGPWEEMPEATSPWTVDSKAGQRFYRLLVPSN